MKHDWQQWIDRLKSEGLSDEEIDRFRQAVGEDPSNRDEYLTDLLAEVALESSDLPDPLASTRTARFPGRRWPELVRIAAAIVVSATAFYLVGRHLSAGSDSDIAATVTDAGGDTESAGLRIGQPLGSGTITIPRNSELGLAMRGGARLEILGPADFDIVDAERLYLRKGRVSTFAPDYAHGFTIETPEGNIIDLGTRFVTAAGTGNGTEVHVIEGLVEATATKDRTDSVNLAENTAGILSNGKLLPTEFLPRRLEVPLDPKPADSDNDGFQDSVEMHFGSNANDASSVPATLLLEESFDQLPAGEIRKTPSEVGSRPNGTVWTGGGEFIPRGLTYSRSGTSLRTAEGALLTAGENEATATLRIPAENLPPDGVVYVSFLMELPEVTAEERWAVLLLYSDDGEELSVGKSGVAESFTSRLDLSPERREFGSPPDTAPHLFVIRIDHNRLLTDIFIDPTPGQPEASAVHEVRYASSPPFDRISIRSGSLDARFRAVFDEIRIGLTWDAVVPAAD